MHSNYGRAEFCMRGSNKSCMHIYKAFILKTGGHLPDLSWSVMRWLLGFDGELFESFLMVASLEW